MRKILFALLLTLLVVTGVSAQQAREIFTTTIVAPDRSVLETGFGIQYHQLVWNVSGTVSTCTVALDSSVDGITWSAGAVISGQTCTSNGASAVSSLIVANYVRINVTTLTGGGTLTATYLGYTASPGGGGGVASCSTTGGVAYENGTANTLTCGANFTYTSGQLLVQTAASGLTSVGTEIVAGAGLGSSYNSFTSLLEVLPTTNTEFAQTFAMPTGTGNTGTTRATFLGVQIGDPSQAGGEGASIAYFRNNVNENQINFGVGAGPFPDGVTLGLNFDHVGEIDLISDNGDNTLTGMSVTSLGGITVFTDMGAPFELSTGGPLNAGQGAAPPLQIDGTTSGHAQIGAAAVAGTPNRMNLPIATGTVGQVLRTDGGSPQQLSWVSVSGGTVTSVVIAGTANQITASGTCTITTTGTCTLSLPNGVILGTDNSAAGTLQLANGSAAAHTIFSSAATTTNTIAGFATVPTTLDLIECTSAATTCTLTDSGILTANVVTAASALANGGVVLGTAGTRAAGTNTQLTFSAPTLTVGLAGTSSGILALAGSTSGSATLTAPAVAGTVTNNIVSSNGFTFNAGIQIGVAGTRSAVITGEGLTSGSATITWPAVAGTVTNAIAFTNAISSGSNISAANNLVTSGSLVNGNVNHVSISYGSPSVSSGFGVGASVTNVNGTAAFTVNVGTGGTASTGVINMGAVAATTGWVCHVAPNGAPQAAAVTYSSPTSTTSVTLTNYTLTTGAALAWTASLVFQLICTGY